MEIKEADAKVVIETTDGEVTGVSSETFWAYKLGKDRYKLGNIPFCVYGVSAGDIVFAPFSTKHHCATFQRVIVKSGNRTLRILFDHKVEEGDEYHEVLQALLGLGCGFEGADGYCFAINVPATVELKQVVELLDPDHQHWELTDPDRWGFGKTFDPARDGDSC